jgi:aspartate/methionine/tyrosine aminotransferase
MRFAPRMQHIGTSGIRDFFDKGKRIQGAIDLSIGMADFDVPGPIKEATIQAIRQGCGKYSVTQGYPEVVEVTRQQVRERFGIGEDEALMLTVGASGAIATALFALAGPGDEVLLPDPYFVVYYNLVHLTGATPVFYDLYPDFRLRAEEVERRLSERTRLVILNSPANPTGATVQAPDLEAVARLCVERGVVALSDELYDLFTYDEPHVSIKRFTGKETLLVGGFSKAYGMAGWRLGWAAGDPELIDRMRTLQQFAYTCPPTLVQLGALAAPQVDMTPQVDAYRRKRDLIHQGLVEAGYEVARPGGSFFIFPRVPWGDDLEFCNRALEEKLILVPGRSFSRRTSHFRISFATDDATLERGLEALGRLGRAGA